MTDCMRERHTSCLSADFWVFHRMAVRWKQRTGQQCRAVSSSFRFLWKTTEKNRRIINFAVRRKTVRSCYGCITSTFYSLAKPDHGGFCSCQYDVIRLLLAARAASESSRSRQNSRGSNSLAGQTPVRESGPRGYRFPIVVITYHTALICTTVA